MAYIGKQNEKANLKEYDQSNENQIQENQRYIPVMERLEVFKQSSKEYKELHKQFSLLLHRDNELQSEGMSLSKDLYKVTKEIIEIPQLAPEETRKKFEQLLSQMPPEVAQKYQELLRVAEDRKEERKILVEYSNDLQTRLNQMTRESKFVERQIGEVDDAIRDLLHQNGLPFDHDEINAAIKKEQEHFRNLNR
ncbi:MAG: hypothetical protein NTY22_08935, partial [Proteobacteria bacterium]|nr:hypothetical protein [Pseudomonadota bacterium]